MLGWVTFFQTDINKAFKAPRRVNFGSIAELLPVNFQVSMCSLRKMFRYVRRTWVYFKQKQPYSDRIEVELFLKNCKTDKQKDRLIEYMSRYEHYLLP